MCKYQLITTNKNIKKQQLQDVYNKNADQTIPQHNLMPVFTQPGMFYSFWDANSWLQNISLVVFNQFRPPYLVVTSENLLKSLIWLIAANCFTRSARQLGNPMVNLKSSLSRSAYENNNELKSSVWLIHVKK